MSGTSFLRKQNDCSHYARASSVPAIDLELPKLDPPRQQTIEQKDAWCEETCPADDDSNEARHIGIRCNDCSCACSR